MKHDIQTIIWDFDGVLLNSNAVRDVGFVEVLKHYPENEVAALLEFHRKNGGLSRYVKFRYFFETIRNEQVEYEKIIALANSFSTIMKQFLTNKSLLIDETLAFVKDNYQKYNMHIASGSDQEELRYLCLTLGIDHYFQSINGSPVPKKTLIANILQQYNYNPSNCVMIGDAINDYEAAKDNDIFFFEYGNPSIQKLTNVPFNCMNMFSFKNNKI